MNHQSGNYENSRIFGILKAAPDTLEGNLTTSQYLETLDRYLLTALATLVIHTRFIESLVAGLVGWQEENFRRRVSLLNKKDFIPKALTWLLLPKADKVKELPNLRLDRGVALLACHAFLDETKNYASLAAKDELGNDDLRVIHDTELRLLAKGGNLSHAVTLVKHQAHLAAEYRGAILSKYFRLSIMAAQRDYVNYFKCRISLNDMCAEYIMASSRAIDKCDYEKGPLTTHIQNWFFTARSHCKKRYDNAILYERQLADDSGSEDTSSANSSDADGNELAMLGYASPTSDSDSGAEDKMIREQQGATVRLLAKLADPSGVARRILGIGEILLPAEKALLATPSKLS